MGRSAGDRVPRGGDRFVTRAEGRTTWHSFSFGAHYDPGNVGFGVLVAHNDERLPPGTGYDDHPHADLEIVTWVLTGALRHTSTVGSRSDRTRAGPAALRRQRRGALRDGRRRRSRHVSSRPGSVPTNPAASPATSRPTYGSRRTGPGRERRRRGRRTHRSEGYGAVRRRPVTGTDARPARCTTTARLPRDRPGDARRTTARARRRRPPRRRGRPSGHRGGPTASSSSGPQ